ncbi:GHMP family kinase ATP-binding protein [Streptomyces albidoflavus]|uniref:GHMP family kinase ATP-binding protein n=1 Tax=Streptomyces albidoflavus TaxID=1886 RepID=UPI00352DF02C
MPRPVLLLARVWCTAPEGERVRVPFPPLLLERRPRRVPSAGGRPTVLNSLPEVLENHAPRSPTVWGACHGTLGELYQGPLPSGDDSDIALVSFPVHGLTARVGFTPGAAPQERTGLRPKAAEAARLFLDHHGLAPPSGTWSHQSELRVGVGMASSTADIVATLRCLHTYLGIPYDLDTVLRVLSSIERADSVFLDEFALHLSNRHRIVRRLGTALRFHTAYITEPGVVDTEAVTRTLQQFYRRRPDAYGQALTGLLDGFSARDPVAVARASTQSAALSQEVLPKETFETVLAHQGRFGADGVFVAHTGCLVGYLFCRPFSGRTRSDLTALFASLGHQCSFAQGGFR